MISQSQSANSNSNVPTAVFESEFPLSDFVVPIVQLPCIGFHKKLRRFFCIPCKSVLSSSGIRGHLKKCHDGNGCCFISMLPSISELASTYPSDDVSGVFNGQLCDYIPGFDVFSGFRCTIGSCISCFYDVSRSSARNHVKKIHSKEFNRSYFRKAFVQCLGKKNGDILFEVHYRNFDVGLSLPMIQSRSLEEIPDDYSSSQSQSPSQSPSSSSLSKYLPSRIDSYEIPYSQYESSFFDEIGFIDMTSLIPRYTKITHEAIDLNSYDPSRSINEMILKRSYSLLKEKSITIKMIIGTSSSVYDSIHNPNYKLLRVVEKETLDKYIKVFNRFILFIENVKMLNTGDKRDNLNGRLSDEQIFIIKDIVFDIEDRFIESIICLLEEKFLVNKSRRSIISIFLEFSCLTNGYNICNVSSLSYNTTSLKYCFRLFILYKVDCIIERSTIDNGYDYERLKEDIMINVKLIKKNELIPFGQLLNISNFARKYTPSSKYERIVEWDRIPSYDDIYGKMILNGNLFSYRDIINKREDLLDEIEIEMNSFFGIDLNIDVLSCHDDKRWHINGSIKKTIRFYKGYEIENHIKDYVFVHCLKNNLIKEDGGDICIEKCIRVKERIDILTKKLYVLTHLSIGGVPRSNEYKNFVFRSFNDNTRSIFIDNDLLCLFTYKSKTSHINNSKYVRFAEKRASKLLILFIMYIKPFNMSLHNIINGYDNENDEIRKNEILFSLFETDFRVIEPINLRRIFYDEMRINGFNMSFKEYRHVNHMVSSVLNNTLPNDALSIHGNVYFKEEFIVNSIKMYNHLIVTKRFIKQSGHSLLTGDVSYGDGYNPMHNNYDYISSKLSSLLYHDLLNDNVINTNKKRNNDIKNDSIKYKSNDMNDIYDNLSDINGIDFKIRDKKQKEVLKTILKKKSCILRLKTGFGKTFIIMKSDINDRRNGICLFIVPYVSLLEEIIGIYKKEDKHITLRWKNDVKFNENINYDKKSTILCTYESIYRNSFGINEYIRDIKRKNLLRMVILDEIDLPLFYNDVIDDNERSNVIKMFGILSRLECQYVLSSSTIKYDDIDSYRNSILNGIDDIDIHIEDIIRENVSFNINVFNNKYDQDTFLLRILRMMKSLRVKTIIFFMSINELNLKSSFLRKNGLDNCIIYSSLKKNDKEISIRRFREDIDIMLSTTSMGSGVNICNVNCIIHYNGFFTIKNYIQEIGRGGRDGSNLYSFTLCNYDYIENMSYFDESVKKLLNSNICIKKMLKYYFDGEYGEECNEIKNICNRCKSTYNDDEYVNDGIIERIDGIYIEEEEYDDDEYKKNRRKYDTNVIMRYLYGRTNDNNENEYDEQTIITQRIEENTIQSKSKSKTSSSSSSSSSSNFNGSSIRNIIENNIETSKEHVNEMIMCALRYIEKYDLCIHCGEKESNHKVNRSYCHNKINESCYKCLRNGHDSSSCNIKYIAANRFCIYCHIPTSLYESNDKNDVIYHRESYNKCKRSQIIRRSTFKLYYKLENDVILKNEFKEIFFNYDDEDEYINGLHMKYEHKYKVIMSVMVFSWMVNRKIELQ